MVMHELMLFADIHTDPASYQIATQLLPELKGKNYTTVYVETGDRSAQEIIEDIDNVIKHLQTFPDGTVPKKSKRTPEQEKFLNDSYLCYRNGNDKPHAISWANETLKFNEGRLEWCIARKSFMEKCVELGFEIVCVDVLHTGKYAYAGGMGERTRYMMNKMNNHLKNKNPSKGILTTGLGHVHDIVESDNNKWCYDQGFLREIEKCNNIQVSECFVFYSKVEDIHHKAFDAILACDDKIVQKIKVLDVSSQPTGMDLGTLSAKAQPLDRIIPSQLLTIRNKYTTLVFPSIQNQKSYCDCMKAYIKDLGGINIHEKSEKNGDIFIEFEVFSKILDREPIRKKLSLSRVITPKIENARAEFLKILHLVLEDCQDDQGNPSFLMTFTDTNDQKVLKAIKYIGSRAVSTINNLNTLFNPSNNTVSSSSASTSSTPGISGPPAPQ